MLKLAAVQLRQGLGYWPNALYNSSALREASQRFYAAAAQPAPADDSTDGKLTI